MDNKESLIMNIMMHVVTAFIVIVAIWNIVSFVPSVEVHKHSDTCYADGTVVCGKIDGELYFTQSKISTPLDVLDYYESRRESDWENLTLLEQLWYDRCMMIFMLLIFLI